MTSDDPTIRRSGYLELFDNHEIPQKKRNEILRIYFDSEKNLKLKYLLRRMLNSFKIKKTISLNLDSEITEILKNGDEAQAKQVCIQLVRNGSIQYLSFVEHLSLRLTDPFFRLVHLRLLAITEPHGIDVLLTYLDDPSEPVVILAMQLISNYPRLESVIKVARLISSNNHKVSIEAKKTLHQFGENQLATILDQLLFSDNYKQFEIALNIISTLAFEPAIPRLRNFFSAMDSDRKDQVKKCLQAMLASESSVAKAALKDLETTTEIQVMDTTDFIPQILDDSDASMIQFLNNQDTHTTNSKALATALLKLPQIEYDRQIKIETLKKFTSHGDHRVRANSIEALSCLVEENSKDYFVSFLNDENNRVRGNAILALSSSVQFIDKYLQEVTICLRSLTQDQRINYQLTGLYCIGIIQDPSLLRVIEETIENQSFQCIDRAIQVLHSWSAIYSPASEAIYRFEVRQNRSLRNDLDPEKCLYQSIENLILQGFSSKPTRVEIIEAKKYLSSDDFEHGLQLLKQLADENIEEASQEIAGWYVRNSNHSNFNAEQLFYYANMGSENGSVVCMNFLAECYRRGWGCQKDYAKWLYWINKACDNNDAEALFRLGNLNDSGRLEGYPRDLKKAFKYYIDAAVQGYPPAMFCLASMYLRQEGIEQDVVSGWLWLDLSSSLGVEESRIALEELLYPLQQFKNLNMQSCIHKWLQRGDMNLMLINQLNQMSMNDRWRTHSDTHENVFWDIPEDLIKLLNRPILAV